MTQYLGHDMVALGHNWFTPNVHALLNTKQIAHKTGLYNHLMFKYWDVKHWYLSKQYIYETDINQLHLWNLLFIIQYGIRVILRLYHMPVEQPWIYISWLNRSHDSAQNSLYNHKKVQISWDLLQLRWWIGNTDPVWQPVRHHYQMHGYTIRLS